MFQALCIGAGVVATSLLAAYLSKKGVADAASLPAMTTRSLGISQKAEFPWGAEPFSMKHMPHCFAIGAVTTAAAIAFTTPSGPITSMDLARGPVLATLVWIWGYYQCISAQLAVKMGGGNEQAARVAERTLYNTLEQGVPFLALLWMTAAFVDAAIATSCGLVYSAFRMLYGVAFSYYGGFSMLCELVTQPNYVIIHLFGAALLTFGLGGGSIFALPLLGQNFFMWSVLIFAGNIVAMLCVWPYPFGFAAGKLNLAWNGAKKE